MLTVCGVRLVICPVRGGGQNKKRVHTLPESLTAVMRTAGHISNVMKKLNVKGRSQAVVELVRLGELQI